uniref:Charged multivesicular body protein 2b n=2 Tax=Macrostomum lignano TaxID=282301 RepID=A0A1I8GKR2_9PLAT
MAFWKKPTVQEQMRANDRELKKTQRDLERDRGHLEREEKRIEGEIKKAAKQGNKEACSVLAKQLVRLRQQKTRSYAMGSKVSAVGTQQKVMGANLKMADAMKTTTKTMGQMNKAISPEDTMKTMRQFQESNMKMEMSEETMNEALDDIFAGSDDEAEQDKVVAQVLDEIGIDMNAQMSKAPSTSAATPGAAAASSSKDDDEEMLKRLAGLSAP